MSLRAVCKSFPFDLRTQTIQALRVGQRKRHLMPTLEGPGGPSTVRDVCLYMVQLIQSNSILTQMNLPQKIAGRRHYHFPQVEIVLI